MTDALTAFPADDPRQMTPPVTVVRSAVVARLARAGAHRIVVVGAPAGYGKTCAVAAWTTQDPRPVAWVRVQPGHRDPARLADAVADARASLPGRDGPGAAPTADVLVLDDAQHLAGSPAVGVIEGLMAACPQEGCVVVVTRRDLGLPLARYRAEGLVDVVGMDDLRFDAPAASDLARARGVRIDEREIDVVLANVHGWPALVSLALSESSYLSPSAGPRVPGAIGRLAADYLRAEVIAQLDQQALDLLMRASVLDRVDGGVVDAMLQQTGTGVLLRELAQTTYLLETVDGTATFFSIVPPLRALLQDELRIRVPAEVPDIHRRAAAFLADHGEPTVAIRQWLAADDFRRAGNLVAALAPRLQPRGQVSVLREWLDLFTRDQIADHPPLALVAAHCAVPISSDECEHWLAVAASGTWTGPLPNGASSLESGVAAVRAMIGLHGLDAMAHDARVCIAGEAPDSPYRHTAGMLLGIALALQGERADGEALIADSVRKMGRLMPTTCVISRSVLAMLAAVDGDWTTVATQLEVSAELVEAAEIGDYGTMALYAAVKSVQSARSGDPAARDQFMHARRLLLRVDAIAPWFQAATWVALADAAVRLADPDLVQDALRDARTGLARVPDAVVLADYATSVRTAWERTRTGEATSLTAAERRVLRYLPTHLSFRAIGAELFLSPFTVKSHAISIYRKLGVTSRAGAVGRARELGLLEAT